MPTAANIVSKLLFKTRTCHICNNICALSGMHLHIINCLAVRNIGFQHVNHMVTVSNYASVVHIIYHIYNHASVVDASGSGQLQANPHVAGPWLSPGKPTRRAVTTMGSNDWVVGEVHVLGPSCQRYNWHTGRCVSIAFGSSPRRVKTLI